MQAVFYIAYINKLINHSLWLGVTYSVAWDVSDDVDVTHLLSDQRTE